MNELEFTGEFVVPGNTPQRIMDDHLERYRFATIFTPGKSVLDISCGTGYGSMMMAESQSGNGKDVVGVDISKPLVQYANDHYTRWNLKFEAGDIVDYCPVIDMYPRVFGLITCFETIEHVDRYKEALCNLYCLLDSGGILLISSPNRPVTSPNTAHITDKPENQFHVREFTPDELISDLRKTGFTVRDHYDLFGQRQSKFHTALTPVEASPVVSHVINRIPRYFVVVARR